MDYSGFIKKVPLPAGFQAPIELSYLTCRAKPLGPDDLAADLAAVNSSADTIHQTRGGSWPEGELTEWFDLQDLAWHDREFRENSSFAYVVYHEDGRYLGCFYLNPMGHAAPLTEELAAFDVDINWWVTTEAYGEGFYQIVYAAIHEWLPRYFPFSNVHWDNLHIPA